MQFAADPRLQLAGKVLGRLRPFSHVQKGLVDGNLLDQGRKVVEERHHLARDGRIGAVAGGHDEQPGAEAHGLAHGHGGMNAVAAGRIGARGYHTAALGPPADGERLAGKRGVALFFYGAEEGVEVEVEDLAGGWHWLLCDESFPKSRRGTPHARRLPDTEFL